MNTCFAQIFWGLLLVVADFRIGRFDILPDFIGYILLAIGCGGLRNLTRQFSTAGTLSWVLFGFSVAGFLLHGRVFGLIQFAVDCAMMWFLLGGVMELAEARDRKDLSERASNRRIAYVAVMCLAWLIGMVGQGSRLGSALVIAVLILCILPLLVLILHLIHRAKTELCDPPVPA